MQSGTESKDKVPDKIEMAKRMKESESGSRDTLVLQFETAVDVLSDKRKELMNTIENQEVNSITELAELVDRDKSRVSKDLKKLYKADIIEFDENKGSKVPKFKHEVIEFEPVVLGE